MYVKKSKQNNEVNFIIHVPLKPLPRPTQENYSS